MAGATALAAGLISPVPAVANHGPSTLEVTAESERNGIGGTTRLIATISPAASNAPGAGVVHVKFKIVSGPNSINADLTAPDFQCMVPPGETVCSPIAFYKDTKASGQFAQTDEIVAWIDHDAMNETAEADISEEQDAGGGPEPRCINDCRSDYGTPGDAAEPDVTDVVHREWGQLKTSFIPYHGGLQPGEQFCDGRSIRNDGTVVAVADSCSFAFMLPSIQETDPNLDYGAVWVQSGVNPRGAGCAKRVATSIAVPDGATLLSVATPSGVGSRRRVVETALTVGDAQLTTDSPTIRQSFFAYPRNMRLVEAGDGETRRLVWEGSTKATLAFAFGLHIAWDPEMGPPSIPTPSSIAARVVKDRTC